MEHPKQRGIEVKLEEGTPMRNVDRFQQIFDQVQKLFPEKSIAGVLYASACRAGNLPHLGKIHKICESNEPCPYQQFFDGDNLCSAEYLDNGYKV